MGFLDGLKHQLLDVIEWDETSPEVIAWKFPRHENEIKNGAQLIVRESQAAVFLHEGELGDVFGPGRHELTTSNIPVLTTLASWKYAFDSPFKCDVFFINTRRFTDRKWGTRNPIMLRDPEFGPVRLRAFGSYCFKISDPGVFVKQISGTDHLFETDEITGQFTNMLCSRFADALGESHISALDLAANYNELGDSLAAKLQPEFDDYGVTLTKLLVENISLPQNVEEALDKRTSMGVIGDMGRYTQYQTANAIDDMANNENGGGAMGMIAGVGMGNIVGGTVNNAAASANSAAPPPIPTSVQWFAAVNGQQTGPFDPAGLQSLIRKGGIKKNTLIWRQGMANWVSAGNVPEISGLFGNQAPPPIPPPIP